MIRKLSREKPRQKRSDRIYDLWKMFDEKRKQNGKGGYDEIVTELLFEIAIALKILRTFVAITLGVLVAALLL